ncbi:MAG: L-serine ammonia-lyase, iron-sulfur-dependent, subunit alpha [Christensenella sp.]|nr:L-serine ammonia-lyase, iron-sulfur-dependent, subunit alpha [Christensenella sp.]
MKTLQTDYIAILKREIKPAVGCTEPVAVAFAAAAARKAAGTGPAVKIDLVCSGNIIKNAMGVRIPGADAFGVKMAAALGAVAGDPEKELEVLSDISPGQVEAAKTLCGSGIQLDTDPLLPKLYISVTVQTGDFQTGKAVIRERHDSISRLEHNGKIIFQASPEKSAETTDLPKSSIHGIYDFIYEVDAGQLGLIEKSIRLNMALSKAGLREPFGHEVGRRLVGAYENEEAFSYAVALTAAGSDARMAGLSMPAMSNSGSGNQGICATVPVAAIGEKKGIPREKILRACTLSNLIAIHCKQSFGRLSPLCGAVGAAIGASAGITYLLGGGLEQIMSSIQNMLGSVMGMLCDGAKAGCAMKVSACTFAAIQSTLLALSDECVCPMEGIIETDVEKTLENIGKLSSGGMLEIDPLLLKIMTQKER